MNGTPYFDRLVASALKVVRHANYPGKDQAIGQCLADIDDLVLATRITSEECEILRSILLGKLPQAA